MKKFYGIEYLRAMGCLGLTALHVCANTPIGLDSFGYQRLISFFMEFVFLFMSISAFGMCCGYFEKVMSGKMDWTVFYKKRYQKFLPLFLFLIVIDLVMDFSIPSLFEGILELTLFHGFLPYPPTVIGVGWFLGITFLFYLMFPFFCVVISSKRSAWFALAISVLINYAASEYFDLDTKNMLYCLCFFMIGGLIYLYKEKIANIKWYFSIPVLILVLYQYYLHGGTIINRLLVLSMLLITAISIPFPKIRSILFISNISMEIYLSHMVFLRVLEKLHLTTLWGTGWKQFLISTFLVFAASVVFSYCFQIFTKKVQTLLKRKTN